MSIDLLERDLESLRDPYPGEVAFREQLRARLERQAGDVHSPRRRFVIGAGAMVATCAAAATLAAVLIGADGGLSGSPSASAAGVLNAAAAAGPGPGQVEHLLYAFTVRDPAAATAEAAGPNPKASNAGTVSVWVAGDRPSRTSQTIDIAKAPGGPDALFARTVQVDGSTFSYDPSHEALALPSELDAAPSLVLPNEAYDGASIALSLKRLAAQGSRVVELPPRTLEGAPVDVIQADGVLGRPALRLTMYFDAHTSLLRGFDAASFDPAYAAPAWTVRLREASAISAQAAPADAFSLDLPAGTSHVAFRPDKQALLGSCTGGTKRPGASLLATCQTARPSLTASQLASELAQPIVGELHAAVADGVIDQNQAGVAQRGLEAQIQGIVVTVPDSQPATARR
jgi:hypothetical protein